MQAIPDGFYRAAWLLPITSPPIENGWMRVENGLVSEFGKFSGQSSSFSTHDLGDVAVLPGLVNAHTHLEFSDLRQPLGVRDAPFPNWVEEVLVRRSKATHLSALRSEVIKAGLLESAEYCTALVGEISTIGGELTDWEPLRLPETPAVQSFLEVLGLSEQRASQCYQWAVSQLSSHDEDLLKKHHGQLSLGLSPHAPYSVPLSLLEKIVALAVERQAIVAMHVAESLEEIELLQTGQGIFQETLTRLGILRENVFPFRDGIDGVLQRLAKAEHAVLVHGNYLSSKQMDYIADRECFSIVYCPRTHAFFGHSPHPVAELLKRGIRVCVGTDSRASNPDLSVWKEAQFLASSRPDLEPSEILRMITIHGAQTLGRKDYGEIRKGAFAKVIQVPISANTSIPEKLFERLFEQPPKLIMN